MLLKRVKRFLGTIKRFTLSPYITNITNIYRLVRKGFIARMFTNNFL
jgi:hypothetical protein